MLKQQIDQDLKAALLAGNKSLAMTLRTLKSAILYVEVAKGVREQGLSDDEITAILAKESKKRQESADLYRQGGNELKAQTELEEKRVIDAYLPKQMDDAELAVLIDKVISDLGVSSPQAMGQVIATVKQQTQGTADGARIATLVKERLAQS